MSPAARIYADYNATAPLRPEARDAMARALDLTGNPSSVHAEGRKARALVEGARETIAAAIGACRDDIAFVSGGTEAVQAPILGALNGAEHLELVVSGIEHDSAAQLGFRASRTLITHSSGSYAHPWTPTFTSANGDVLPLEWPTLKDGTADLDWLKARMAASRAESVRPIVSLMMVNNETGVVQPVAEAAAIVHGAGGWIHCDAIQGVGKIEVNVTDLDVDYLSVSAHKLGGPQGVGAFFVRPNTPFVSVQTGGGQEFGRRAGTENVAGIVGFAAAADAALRDMASYQALAAHRDRMEARLKAAAPGLQVHGGGAPRVAGVSCFGVEGLPSETQIMGMDLAGIAISAGSACSSGKVRPSRVLSAMGLSETAARSAIRASFGWASKAEDFDALAEAWIKMARRVRDRTL